MPVARFVDQNGQPIALGRELGRGGEATVYEVAGRSDLVAKIYHSAPRAVYQKKLPVLVAATAGELLRFAAWPSALLYDSHSLRGFTMPRISALRSFVMNHIIHHRGQLTVYLRLKNVPLPPIYGPTADEQ